MSQTGQKRDREANLAEGKGFEAAEIIQAENRDHLKADTNCLSFRKCGLYNK